MHKLTVIAAIIVASVGACLTTATAAPSAKNKVPKTNISAEENADGDDGEASEASSTKNKAPKTLPGGWVYAWGDEFNGNKLDETKWKCELGPVRNKGVSHSYVPEAVTVEKGKLVITSAHKTTRNPAFKENAPNWAQSMKEQPWMSGSVTTRDIKHFTLPGRLEFRAKIPKAPGVWPAIWTMHVNKYGWPANGEIDILEHISQEPDRVYSLFRWGENGGNREHKVIRTTDIPNYSKKFHTYALQWDEEVMLIEIDGKEVGRIAMSAADYPNGDNPLKTPCYLIINTAIGGNIGGNRTWPEVARPQGYPVRFEIDYVRYYTKAGDKSSAGDSGEPKKRKGGKASKPAKNKKR